ncbi:MAG: beta-galactosidase [Bacteroidales bacterium]|nr:beta-galactosidase [Bacteroidales bacterium]
MRLVKEISIAALLLLVMNIGVIAQQHNFQIGNSQFLYDGKPIQIHSGEMHYPRIPEAYWRHRVQMAKAMGLNTIAVYCFWNFHNTSPGVWDFNSERHDVTKFIKICQEEEMFVILRPGPYVCAEWEFGGYPWWIQNNSDLVIRTNQPFLDSCKVYIHQLAGQLKDLQITHGGPIIMVQVENEFGSYMAQRTDIPKEQHRQYYLSIQKMLQEAGFDVPMFTSDGDWLFEDGAIPGVLPTANGEVDVENLKKCVDAYYPGGPYMVAEYYPGWLDHWAEPFVRINQEQTVNQIEKFLQNNISFNIYMVHGGTNFAFTSGANFNDTYGIQPDITSYDYDAPISESGMATLKYLALRELMKKYVTDSLPEIPAPLSVIKIPDIKLNEQEDFFEWKNAITAVKNDTPLSFEQLGQGHGYVLYSKRFEQAVKGKMMVNGLRDYALVYINGNKIGALNRIYKTFEMEVDIPANGKLEILVENMGRINYGAEIPNNFKGIISLITINGTEIRGDWEMYKIPMDQTPKIATAKNAVKAGLPAIYRGTFYAEKPGDVFLDMQGWGKGIVFVNGKNLGRYWKVGPQQTLYLPGCWLRQGENEVVIFEQLNDNLQSVLKTTDRAILEELNIEKI